MEGRDDANLTPRLADENSTWSWRATLLAAGAIIVAAIVAYHNSFSGEFMFDDQGWIADNASIHHLWPIGDVLFPADAEHVGGRPVVSLTLALNYALGGLDVRGYHATNLAIHILAALTLFGVVRRTLALPRLRDRFGPAATPLAAAVALIWVVHPMQTEAVSYVIQRAESLVGMLYLLTLYCVIRGATTNERAANARSLWYSAAAVACLLGMATKEVMVTVPLLVLLYDVIFLSGSFRKSLSQRWGLYTAMAVTWSVLIWVLGSTDFHGNTTGFHAPRFTPWTYFITEPGVLVMYLRLAFWPDALCFAYDLRPPLSVAEVVLPGLGVLVLLALTCWALVKRPAVGFLGAAFFLILAPTSTIVPIIDAAFEHRMYLPLSALVTLVVVGGYGIWTRLFAAGLSSLGLQREHLEVRWGLPALAVCATVVVLAWATVVRNRDYESVLAIWRDTVSKRPNDPRAHCNFGCALSRHGKVADAITHYQCALALDPDNPACAEASQNWGSELALQGQLDEAIPHFENAIRIRPEYAEAHYNLALALAKRGETGAAVEECRAAVRFKPDYAEARFRLGQLLGTLGKFDEAAAELTKAVEIKPDIAAAHSVLAGLLAQQGKLDEAALHARRALQIDPGSADAHNALGGVLMLQGMTAAAVAEFERALAIKPDYAEALFNLGLMLEGQGNSRAATGRWRDAIRLQPNNPAILNSLAWTLATNPDDSLRDGVEAVDLAQRAVQLTERRNPAILATLAAAEAEAGQYPKAVEIAERALDLSAGQQPSDPRFAEALGAQIKLYETGFPYHEPRRP